MLGYHLAVGRAAAINGWRHVVATSPEHGLAALPPGWHATLETGALETGLPQMARQGRLGMLVRQMARFSRSVAAAIRAELDANRGPCIVFVERFNGPELLAILWAAWRLDRSRLHLWVMFRQEPSAMGVPGMLYVAVGRALAALFGRGQFRLLADSEPLAESLSRSFSRPAHVMPIPHTHVDGGPPGARSGQEVLCWWPGSARPEKGLDAVLRLASLGSHDAAAPHKPLRLVVSRESGLARQAGPVAVEPVDDVLSPQDYQMWLRTADVLLLPYSAQRYRTSTSGIFAECIAAGKISVVTPDTWMAVALARHDLAELVLDWSAPDLPARIARVASDPSIKRKVEAMRTAFLRFHCEESFAHEMRTLFPPASPSTAH